MKIATKSKPQRAKFIKHQFHVRFFYSDVAYLHEMYDDRPKASTIYTLYYTQQYFYEFKLLFLIRSNGKFPIRKLL